MWQKIILLFLIIFLNIIQTLSSNDEILTKRRNHQALEITNDKLRSIAEQVDSAHLQKIVENILIPRVVGTPGHDVVRDFIAKSMDDLGWHNEFDKFTDETPVGEHTFENIISTLNPNAERFLVLSCHYDSKHIPGEEFLGATDSAVPCAMLINLAFVMKNALDKRKTDNDLSIKLIFFDGEEAFVEWTATDSIYGSRHLAKKWHSEGFLPRIDMLVLLDLIGMPDPVFYNFFADTENWYARIINIEERLASMGHLRKYTNDSTSNRLPNRYFQARSIQSFVDDDHTPFMNLGVPIIHVIPIPFPDVWHKPSDNHEAIDYDTVENINKIMRVLIAEYLHLEV